MSEYQAGYTIQPHRTDPARAIFSLFFIGLTSSEFMDMSTKCEKSCEACPLHDKRICGGLTRTNNYNGNNRELRAEFYPHFYKKLRSIVQYYDEFTKGCTHFG